MPLGITRADETAIQNRDQARILNTLYPTIVTDGLLAYLDAGNYQSYPAGGTRWIDVSGNNAHADISNLAAFTRDGGGGLNFNISPTGQCGFGNLFNFTNQSFSFNLVIYLTSTTTSTAAQGPVILYKGPFNTAGYYVQINQASPPSVAFFTNQGGTNQSTSSTQSLVVGGWNNLCFTRSGSSIRIYLNGADITSTAGTHTNPTLNTVSFLLNSYGGGQIFGDVTYAIFAAYNRALTPQEVLQNFNATRQRFGL